MPTRMVRATGLVAVLGMLGVAGWMLAPPREAMRGHTTSGTARAPVAPRALIRMPGTPEERRLALRNRLYEELQPVRLEQCAMERVGEAQDGGYLLCANLLDVEAGYSYGINNYDGWGCGIATQYEVPVHQYDCFDTRAPQCATGTTRFHAECIGGEASTDADGRRFDTLAAQLRRNGDASRRVVVKMDVEGAEWESLLATPREVLERIDQLTLELHEKSVDLWTYYLVVMKLKDVFHIVNLHFNNYACRPGLDPFPSWAYEVLLVNKRFGEASRDTSPVLRPHPLDTPNDPRTPDCQYVAQGVGARPGP